MNSQCFWSVHLLYKNEYDTPIIISLHRGCCVISCALFGLCNDFNSYPKCLNIQELTVIIFQTWLIVLTYCIEKLSSKITQPRWKIVAVVLLNIRLLNILLVVSIVSKPDGKRLIRFILSSKDKGLDIELLCVWLYKISFKHNKYYYAFVFLTEIVSMTITHLKTSIILVLAPVN